MSYFSHASIKRERESDASKVAPAAAAAAVAAATRTSGISSSARMAFERESGELLEHLRDSTEQTMTGNDETAQWAYGSNYYLSKAAASEAQGSSTGGRRKGTAGVVHAAESEHDTREEKAREVLLNVQLAPPAFFFSGDDFPAIAKPPAIAASSSSESYGHGDPDRLEEGGGHATSWVTGLAAASDMDIVLPCVSTTCALSMSATKGSAALAEHKRTLERERINRDAMDTSKSGLTELLRKDHAGHMTNTSSTAVLPIVPGSSSSGGATWTVTRDGGAQQQQQPPQQQHDDFGGGNGQTVLAGGGEDAEEEELLRRRIRLEKERQRWLTAQGGPQDPQDTHDAAAVVAGENAPTDLEAEKHTSHTVTDRQRRRLEKKSDIARHQADLEAHQDTDTQADHRQHIRAQKRSLPIYRCKPELMRYIGENPVVVLVGETGSGKTTQLVQYLYEMGYAQDGKVIGCTQPRRLAAVGVARRVSDEMNCAVGTTVGYSIHLDDTTSADTAIKFMTDGVLLREIVKDPDVNKYSVLVLDEAHERSVDTDVLMGVLKQVLQRRGDLKLIVTSATMDIHRFSAFFGHAPFYEIPGQTFDVAIQYSPTVVADYVAEAVFRVCQLHLQMPLEGKHDILVFMTGRDDVYGTCELIKRRLYSLDPKRADTLFVLPCLSEGSASLTAGGGGDGGLGVLEATPPGMRKCVVATNVAETSLTIDGVRYVVDCGFMKTNVYRPKIGMNTLQRYPISQAQAGQRKGRAGRTTEGVCFRLYTATQFDGDMLVNSVPEIQRSSIESVVLLLKSIGVRKIARFDFMDPPPPANTRTSMWHLWVLGLLDDSAALTEEGRLALEFPMAPALAKLLIESTKHGCAVEMARVVALIAVDPKNLFELPKGKEETAQQHHSHFFSNDSDHLTFLNVLTQFIDNGKSRQWAQDHFLHMSTLLRAVEVLDQLMERLRRLKLPIVSCGFSGVDTVRYCLALSFCMQSAKRSGSNWTEYRPLLNAGVVCALHPSSAVCSRAEMPSYVIYNDLLMINKEYLVMVTAVEPEWLVEGSRGLFRQRSDKTAVIQPGALAGGTVLTTENTKRATVASASSSAGQSHASVTAPAKAPAPAVKSNKPASGASKFSMMAGGRRRPNI